MVILETERLVLRPFQMDDVAAAYAWFGDDSVMRYAPNGADRSLQQTADRLARYAAHQTAHGFSKWMITDKASGQPIGDAGLLDLDQLRWIDLGYRLAAAHWGKGLATEAASAWVRAAFGELGFERLGAFCHQDNTASKRVLDKLGFRSQRRDTIMGMPSIVFSLERPPSIDPEST